MRPSLKACVWLGEPDCHRNQAAILLSESAGNRRDRLKEDFDRDPCPSRVRSDTAGPRDDYRRMRTACLKRGGTTPFNVLPIGSDGRWSGGTHGHGASTPLVLCDDWVRYICPEGGVVLDPFMGSGTIPLAAIRRNRSATGFEQMPEYFEMAQARLDGPPTPLFDGIADLPVADETPLFSGATS
jgi:hypothetical protein